MRDLLEKILEELSELAEAIGETETEETTPEVVSNTRRKKK